MHLQQVERDRARFGAGILKHTWSNGRVPLFNWIVQNEMGFDCMDTAFCVK